MSDTPPKKILMLGCSTKAGTYVTKQLHKLGYKVTIFDWKGLPNAHSRYTSAYIHCTSPEKDLEKFEAELLQFLSQQQFTALLPLHDPALEAVRHLGARLPATLRVIGLNGDDIYKYAHNKWELLELARKHNIPVPATVYISSVEAITASPFGFPCVVKPVSSALVKDGRLYTFPVSVVKTQQELEDKIREVILNVPVMVQEFIEGYGIGFNFISNKGGLLNSYIHERITEYRGVSSYRKIAPDTAYGNKEPVTELIRNINWTGVGMMEFKVRNNIPVLMELNGRFFGSIEVSVKSGLNLPKQFMELLLENKVPQKDQPFNLTTKVRNLHDEVLLNFAALVKGQVGRFVKWKLGVLRSLFTRSDFIEDNLFDDPGFVIALYTTDLKRSFRKFKKKLGLSFLNIAKHKLQAPDKKLRIGFVCKGNICRSPFAALYAASVNRQHSFYSFGTFPHENRLSPVNALEAAQHLGISLEKHSSRFLKTADQNNIDLFVVMDKLNYMDLRESGIPASKIRFLAGQEIPDPYGKNYDYFVSTYSAIKKSIDELLKHEKIS